jgi:hypothetical protein
MRRGSAILMTLFLALSGCTMLDRQPAAVVAPTLKPVGPAIRPDEVTPSNARDKARLLNEELDRDMDGEFLGDH